MPGAPHEGSGAGEHREGPSWLTKLLVVAFLLLFVGLAVNKVEAWPFTAWRLFSERRGPVSTGFRAYALDQDGVERALNLETLPVGYRQAGRLLLKFPHYSEADREGVCEAIAKGDRAKGDDPKAIRVYKVVERSHIHDGKPVKTSTRSLRFACDANEGRA